MSPYASYIVETAAILFAVILLGYFIVVVSRRMASGRSHGALELVGSLMLEPKLRIHLVRVAETVFIVGAGEGGIIKLGEIARSDLPRVPIVTDPFTTVLSRLRRSPSTSKSHEA